MPVPSALSALLPRWLRLSPGLKLRVTDAGPDKEPEALRVPAAVSRVFFHPPSH